MILSFFSVKIIPAAYAAHDCKLYISHLPIPIWNEEIKNLSLIHISEPTRLGMISYAVFCLKKKHRPHKVLGL